MTMQVDHIEIMVEEPSAEAALRILLPRMLEHLTFDIVVYQSKPQLLERLPRRFTGYAKWLPPNQRILVLVDKDDNDCLELKAKLEAFARNAGLSTKTANPGGPYQVINRIVVEELESWFFGDWQSVRKAYPKVSSSIPQQARYRTPDAVTGGTWEALERILQKAGYFSSGLRKIEAARAIAEHMQPEVNTSHSFQVFRQALLELSPP